jgi:glycerol-3-phosphate acyltransferase PlsX
MYIAIDAMSGDWGLSVAIPAAVTAVKKWDDLNLILVGDKEQIVSMLPAEYKDSSRILIQHASEVVLMDDHPVQALRQKKDSSMRVAIDLVKKNEATACLSSGNTGALMATSTLVLRTIKSIERPAICAAMPSQKGWVYTLDLGANVDVSAVQLHQFALMGIAMVQAIENIEKPTVGLMNVGSEESKGNKITQEAHALISNDENINYLGFVEGDDIYVGNVDVIVMGGLEGNIALKTSEGLAKYISAIIKQEFKANILNKIIALISYPILKNIAKKLSPSKYNGACLIGLNGIVVKSHGNADINGFLQAIGVTRQLAQNNTPEKIKNLIRT